MPLRGERLFELCFQHPGHGLLQPVQPPAMSGRDSYDIGKAMRVGVPDEQVAIRSIDLVHHQQELLRAGAQPADELLVLRSGFHGVQHQEDEVGFPRGLQAPRRHYPVQPSAPLV